MKLVSVYIPTKDRHDLLERAVLSVLNQTYENIELIIVNDGGASVKTERLKPYFSLFKSYQIIELDQSVGAPAARNIAIENANGYFISGLDDDDYFLQDRISYFVEEWDDKYAFLSARTKIEGFEKFNFIKDSIIRKKRVFSYKSFFDENVSGNQIFTLTERLKENKFDVSLPALQDFELWFRLSKVYGDFLSLKERTQVIDIGHGLSRITNLGRRDAALKKVIDKHQLNINDFRCLKLFWQVEFGINLSFNDCLFLIGKSRFKLLFVSFFRKLMNTGSLG